MFQYAAGRRLAHALNVPFKLDIFGFKNDPLRKFELDRFSITAGIAAEEEVMFINSTLPINTHILNFLSFLKPVYKHRLVRERTFHFDPEVLRADLLMGMQTYLDGYWQSEKYFKDIENIIRNEFVFKSEPDSYNKAIGEAICATNAISLHVRRGDYVSNSTTNKYHGVCSLEFYRRAVNLISDTVPTPHFYVFSDDPEWVKHHLLLVQPVTYVDSNVGDKSFEDMRLMSLCRHHIIANSSFSWWAAWLCANPEKTVIAPERWFNKKNIDTSDLIPPAWIRLSDGAGALS